MNGKLSAYYKMCSQSNNTKSSYSFFYSIFTIAVFILFTIQNIFCQIENINFQHLTTKDGLSQSSVVSIIQDTMGFMWFGTYDGLNRYDGHKFKIYRSDPRDPHSLSLNQVTSFLKDRLGRLWVGTVGGLNLYNAGKDQFIQFTSDSLRPESLSSNMIQNMVQDNYGNIWISTYGGGVNVLTADSWINDSTMNLSEIHPENVKFIHYLHDSEDPNSLASNNATAVFMDKKGTIWVGQDHGISKFNEKNKKFIHYSIPNVDNTRNICFEEDSYGSLWVGTWSSGLFRFDPNTETFDSYSPNTGDTRGISHTVIREIYEDKNHDLWVGTYGGGLHFYDRKNDKFKVFISDPNNPTSLSSNSVSAIYEDKSNMLWIGCEFAGINMFDKNYRQFHPKKIDRNKLGEMSSNSVTTIYITKSGKETYLWLGTWESGLLKINTLTNEYTVYDHDPNDPNSLSDNLIRDFAVDKDGIFWIGTNSGLNKFDWKTEKFTQFKNDPNDPGSLSADNVFSLHIDKSNTVWVGTWGGGLNKYDRKSGNFIHFRHNENDPNSISENIIWSILEDSHGDLWVGTNNAGLNRLADYKKLDKDAKFIHYISNPEDPNSLSDNKVLNMYEDGSGNLWIGTTHGLNKYIPGSDNFIHYTHDDGLAGNSIQGILEDNNHMLWISTTSGLSRFNPESETFKNYSVNNGLQNDEFGVKSSFKSKDGSLYFGGPNGFNYFDPEEIKDNYDPPPIVLTDFQVFNKSVPIDQELEGHKILKNAIWLTDNIRLSHFHNVFSFEYAALQYNSPENNQYAYKMEGFEKDWNYVGNRRFATYINLPAGEYSFRVKGANSNGVWNEKGASVKIHIIPPLWKTSWFMALSLILFSSLIYAFYRYRMNLINIRTVTLKKMVAERTNNLSKTNKQLRKEISARKKIEQELVVAKETAEIASQFKSAFLSNMSHEIRTPMNGIIGLTDLLLDTGLSSEQYQYLTTVKNSADQLLYILNDILDFSKIEAGQLDLERINFNLRSAVEHAADALIYVLEQKNLQLNIYIDNNVPVDLIGDPVRLRQILMNLISNAIKFTDEGEITIKTELNKISGKKAIIHFSVTDTGIGIPKNQQDSIFQSFTQADSSTTRRYGGTGLGLSISKQLVELMGGEIWVESPADMSLTSNRRILSENYSGSGSTFHFTAQFHLQSIQERNETLASADIRNISVLVVDDNDTNKVILQQMLKNFKCDPVLVSNGKEALENLDKKEFRLIISDFQMPEMDGAELVGKIRAKYKTPIILLTSIGKTKEFRTLENLGSVVTVSKPVKQSQLYNAITTVLNSSPVKISEKNDKAKLQDKSVTELSKLNKKVKILLAEDNRINQKVALALLKRTGIPVDVASDGNLAVAALKDKKYDLVLMDIQMPNLDGISASQIIRNDLKMPDIPIIAMTAQAMKGDKERCMSAGMNDYISKPISPYQLYNTLLKWINTNHKVQ